MKTVPLCFSDHSTNPFCLSFFSCFRGGGGFAGSRAIAFDFAKDDYDEQNEVDSSYKASTVAMWVAGGLNIFSSLLTSLTLLQKGCKKCCKNVTNNNSISTEQAAATRTTTSAPAATATTTVDIALSSAGPSFLWNTSFVVPLAAAVWHRSIDLVPL